MNRLMGQDAPWAPIARAWQQREELPRVDPTALRRAVKKDTSRMRRWLALEVILSVAALAFAMTYAARVPGTWSRFLLMDTVAVIVIVWLFALWGRRGLWLPAAECSEAYVALARRRTRLKLLTTWLALGLVAGQVVAAAVVQRSISAWQLIGAGVWVGWALWTRRRATRELRFYGTLTFQSTASDTGSEGM